MKPILRRFRLFLLNSGRYITRKGSYGFLKKHMPPWLGPESFVVDIGGALSTYRPLFRNARYVPCDIERTQHTAVVGDAHALPFRDESIDLLVSTETFEHLHSPQLAAKEMYRVLRPGGALLLTTRFIFPVHEQPHDYYRYTTYGLRHLFRQFEDLRVEANLGWMETFLVLTERLICEQSWILKLASPFLLAFCFIALPFAALMQKLIRVDTLYSGVFVAAVKRPLAPEGGAHA